MSFDELVLRLGRTTAVRMDVAAVLADVCRTARSVLGVRVVVAAAARQGETDLDPVVGSDDAAMWIGRLQRDARRGPLATAMSCGRPTLTNDLLRVGPPELAAAAAETGLTSSLAIPLVVAGEAVGAVQLLGDAACPAGPGLVEPLSGVLDVLAARLVDARLAGSQPGDAVTEVLPLLSSVDTDVDTAVLRVESPAEADPGRHREPEVARPRPAPPVAVAPATAGSALPVVPTPSDPRRASPPSPWPRPRPPEVQLPAPRYHDHGATTFGATAAAATAVAEPAAAEATPGRRRRES